MSLDDEDRALTSILYADLADVLPYFRLSHYQDLFLARRSEAAFIAKYVETTGKLPTMAIFRRKFPGVFSGPPRRPEPLSFCIDELTEQLVASVCTEGADEMQQKFTAKDLPGFITTLDTLSAKLVSIRAPLASSALAVSSHTDAVLARIAQDAQAALRVVPTGLPPLDLELGGGARAGMLVTLSALINLGKTYVMCAVATNMKKAGYKVLFVPLEMTSEDIAERCLCVEHGLNANWYIKREMPPTETRSREEWYTDLLLKRRQLEKQSQTKGEIYIRTDAVVTPRLIRSWVKELKVDAVIIDAAQDVRASNPKIGRTEGLYVAIAEITALAVENQLPVFCTVQLAAEVEKKGITKGNLANIQWAQVFAQKSHAVFTMLGDRSTCTRDVTTDKNRDGQVGRPWQIDMQFPEVKITAHALQPVGITLTAEDVFSDITTLKKALQEEELKERKERAPLPVKKVLDERKVVSTPSPESVRVPVTPYQKRLEERADKRAMNRLRRKV